MSICVCGACSECSECGQGRFLRKGAVPLLIMAAGQAVSSSHGLGEDDLVCIYEALYPVRAKYTNFGLCIGVKKVDIDNIQKKQADSDERLLEILSVRLKQTPALTWDIIDKALRSPIVGELQLADTLQRTHYSKGSDPLSCPSTSDQEPQQKAEKESKQKRKYEKHVPTQQHSRTSEDDSDEEVGEVIIKWGRKKAKSGSKYFFLNKGKEILSNTDEEAPQSDDDSSPSSEESSTSFREVKKETRSYSKRKMRDFSGDEELHPHGSSWQRQRKRSRKRYRESMSSTAVESSFPSASLEEYSSKAKRRRGDCRRSKNRRGEEIERGSLSSSTEMDDSSPECDMLKNLTESETQKLRQIFKCAFGKLCCTITEPVQTAAELQGKRLVSLSTMKDMVASPESQQVKTIALIHALYRKIKSRSDRIFTVIEIFLKSDVLREVGRKLWFEAGTIILPMYESCHKILLFCRKSVS